MVHMVHIATNLDFFSGLLYQPLVYAWNLISPLFCFAVASATSSALPPKLLKISLDFVYIYCFKKTTDVLNGGFDTKDKKGDRYKIGTKSVQNQHGRRSLRCTGRTVSRANVF